MYTSLKVLYAVHDETDSSQKTATQDEEVYNYSLL